MTTKKFVAVLAMGFAFVATAAFAAPREVHSWEELQRLCRVQLAQRDNQGNSTSDGGRLGYLRWDVEWKVTDDWRVYSGSTSERKSGEVLPAGSEFYAWFLGGETPQEQPTNPATPTNPTDDKKNTEKEEPIEVSSFEEFAMIVSGDVISNDDGGFGGELLKPLKVAPGQRVLCGSDTPLKEGEIVSVGKTVYLWLAPEGYGLELASDMKTLRKAGNLEEQDDGIWYSYRPDDLMKVDLEVFGVVNVDDPSDDIREGLLRENTAYYLCLRDEYLNFVPKDDSELSVLCRPDDAPIMKERDEPEGEPARQNWHVRIPFDWRKADNCRVLNGSNTPQPVGAIQKAGSLLYISVQPITDPDKGGNGGGSNGSGDGGGGGCDAGMGLPALLALALFLLRKSR